MEIKKKASVDLDDAFDALYNNLSFAASEQYKLLRANLAFTLPEHDGCAIIGVTSSIHGEGKSTTAVNLSHALAESGNKVALIDGDLRLPSVAKKLNIPSNPGLTDLLLERGGITFKSFELDSNKNWSVIPSGELPPNPSELLGSKKMEKTLAELSKLFDYIIIDLPPINVVSDALTIANHISGMVLVIREEYTTKKELSDCIRQIELTNVKILGCVMNAVKQRKGSYGRRSKYYKKYSYLSSYAKEQVTETV